MRVSSRVQGIWLQQLGRRCAPGEAYVQEVEFGYYTVVLLKGAEASSDEAAALSDFRALRSRIRHLERTRAVYLDSADSYRLPEGASLRSWAGDLAAEVEGGARQAFAVVDTDVFKERVEAEFAAEGWNVEAARGGLKVNDGQFAEQVNLLRAVVRMVLSRSTIAEAARVLVREVREQLALYARLFGRFRHRLEKRRPALIDHFFVVQPGDSCAALGWDYWEVSGVAAAEADQTLERAIGKLEAIL